MDSLCIIMPAYNEEENIGNVIRQWYPLLNGKGSNSKFIINTSGCTDGTADIIQSLSEEFEFLSVIDSSENAYGPKVIDLYQNALESGADYIFQTDSDGQTNPNDFGEFWDSRMKYDAVIGDRTQRGDGWQRAMVEFVVCILVRIYFGVRVPDANAPFRLFRRQALYLYMEKLPKEYFMPNIMLTVLSMLLSKDRTAFKTISFQDRSMGKNKMNMKKIFKGGLDSLKDFYNIRKIFKKQGIL